MRGLRRGGLLAVLVLAALALPVHAGAADSPFDDLPGVTMGDAPYRSTAVFDQTTQAFDTTSFTEQQREIDAPFIYLSCSDWGAKDAWVRFNTAVAGNLLVAIDSAAAGDVLYNVYTAPTVSPAFTELTELDCSDELNGPAESYAFGHEIPANTVVFVQALMQCAVDAEPCTAQEREEAPGGQTTMRLRFKPHNADGDAFPDSIDACPAAAGPAGGCPDGDGDGVADGADACPGLAGRGANGCRLADDDGDGHNATSAGGGDCNDDNPAIGPAASDIPQNGADEDCNGRDSPYPRLRNEVSALAGKSLKLGRTIGFLAPFKVGGPFVSGMAVRLRCRGLGCPFSRQAVAVRRPTGAVTIGEALVGRTLAPRTEVTLTVTRRGYIGIAMRYTIRRRGKLRIETLCVLPGDNRPRKKCG